MKYINEDEKFWKHSFHVYLTQIGEPLCVNADHAQDALDYAVDHAEEKGWMGYFLNEEDIASGDYLDDMIVAGNHGLTLVAHEVHIEQLD